MGFEYKGEVEKHSSQKGKSMGVRGPLSLCPASVLPPMSCAVCCAQAASLPAFVTRCRFLFPVSPLQPHSLLSCHTFWVYIVPAFCVDANHGMAEQGRRPHVHPTGGWCSLPLKSRATAPEGTRAL